MLLFSLATHKCSLWQGQPKQGRPPMGASPFTVEKCELLKEACWKGITEPCPDVVNVWGRGVYRKTVGLYGGPCLSEEMPRNLRGSWSAQLWSSAVSTEQRWPVCWAANSLCRDSGVQWKRGWMRNQKTGVTLSPGTRCFISLNHYFPNEKQG